MSRMIVARYLGVLCLGLSCLCANPGAATESVQNCQSTVLTPAMVADWAKGVSVIAYGQSGGTEYGLGFVVGWDGPNYWIATAAHVIGGKTYSANVQSVSSPANSIRVFFSDESEASPLCDERPVVLPGNDLAFICVRPRRLLFLTTNMIASRIDIADKASVIGVAGAFVGSAHAGVLPNVEGSVVSVDEEGVITLRGMSDAARGQSGAPVLSNRGMIGMFQGHEQFNGQVLSAKAIESAAAYARIPWSLTVTDSFDCKFHRNVCAHTVGPGNAQIGMALYRFPDMSSLTVPAGGCVRVPEGKYDVRASNSALVCRQAPIMVFGGPDDLKLNGQCSVNIDGLWRSDETTMNCALQSSGVASCTGLQELGYGIFSGQLTIVGEVATLAGYFTAPFGAPIPGTGHLRVESQGLVGSISYQGLAAHHITFVHQ